MDFSIAVLCIGEIEQMFLYLELWPTSSYHIISNNTRHVNSEMRMKNRSLNLLNILY